MRRLPITLAPLHQETLGSYLNRLADANRLSITALSATIVGRPWDWRRDSDHAQHWAPDALDRLAAATGRSAEILIHALPALREAQRPPVLRLPPATIEQVVQPRLHIACYACAARHGVHGLVIRRLESHHVICRRHRRWLADSHQHPLHGLPEVTAANRRHRTLTRRHGTMTSELAYRDASRLMQQRFHQPGYDALQHLWNLRLGQLAEDPYGDPYKPSPGRIELVTYPEAVAITTWLAQHPDHDLRGDRVGQHLDLLAKLVLDDGSVIIAGYLDGYEPPFLQSPLIDGTELMANDLFWPAFLYTVGGAVSAPKAFAADAADLSELIDQFLDPDRWPVFSMPLMGRSHLRVVMRNFPGEGGVDYILDPGRSHKAIPLAALEGHFRGPALAWSELIAAARQPDSSLSAAQRLLLLLPACADANRPRSAVDVIAAALTAIGARSHQRQVSSELLDTHQYWTPCPWTLVDDTLICLGPHAYRRPGGTLSPDDLRLITTALSEAEGA